MISLGVDAHKRVHAAVAVDGQGRELAQWRGGTTVEDWQAVLEWGQRQGPERLWGIEGAGQYGRGLAQYLVAAGERVVEVNPRQTAAMRRAGRERGKSDRLDARAVARVVAQDGDRLSLVPPVDVSAQLAVLVAERDSNLQRATQLRNQLHQLLLQLDPAYEQTWSALTAPATISALTTYPAQPADNPLRQTYAASVRRLATQLQLVLAQAATLKGEIEALARQHLQPLLAISGVGPLAAGMLAAHLGPGQRFASDARLAMHAGVAPLEASSGETVRHRLNRSGNRQLNAIVHRIVLTQARCYAPAQTYLAKRRQDGKTEREAVRALKRYVVRAVFRAWQDCGCLPRLDQTLLAA